jgi:hypothetical protein
MRVFISWSGRESHEVALAFREWLRYIFPTIEPFLSSEDMRKGGAWGKDLAAELSTANHGLVVLTLANYSEPWILYESGALSKSLASSALWTVLAGGIAPEHLEGSPLSLFQHTRLDRNDVFRLAKSINSALDSGTRTEIELSRIVEDTWSHLEQKLQASQKASLSEKKTL